MDDDRDSLLREVEQELRRDQMQKIWERYNVPILGGALAIVVAVGGYKLMESRRITDAEARGAATIARIAAVESDRCPRAPGEAAANATRQLAAMPLDHDGAAVLSGAAGVAASTREELTFLDRLGLPVRATGTALGHSMEPSFIANIALAADAVARGVLFGPLEPGEGAMAGPLRQVLVTGWGHWRGEGMALVVKA